MIDLSTLSKTSIAKLVLKSECAHDTRNIHILNGVMGLWGKPVWIASLIWSTYTDFCLDIVLWFCKVLINIYDCKNQWHWLANHNNATNQMWIMAECLELVIVHLLRHNNTIRSEEWEKVWECRNVIDEEIECLELVIVHLLRHNNTIRSEEWEKAWECRNVTDE